MRRSTKEEINTRNKRIQQIIAMREKGMSNTEIGKKLGISRQRVEQIVPPRIKYFRVLTPESCKWSGLRNWMNKNSVSKTELVRRLYGNAYPENYARVIAILKEAGRNTPKYFIDNVLNITGLTYEEIFKE